MTEFYFGREFEQAHAMRLLQSHNDILLVGPRRIGKTTLCRHLVAQVKQAGWKAALVDIAGCSDEEEVMRMIEAQTNSWWDGLKDLWQRSDINFGDWNARTDALPWAARGRARCQALAQHKRGALLILDEAPVFLKRLLDADRDRGERWAHALRSWRQQAPGMRFVLAGSIGLNTLAERHRITTSINDLTPLELGAFDDQQADAFLLAYAAHWRFELTDAARAQLMQVIGWHVPKHHIELISAAQQASRSNNLTEAAQIDAGLAALLRHHGSFLVHWRDRLDDYGSNDARKLRDLLTRIAQVPQGVAAGSLGPDDGTQRYFLNLLEDEGYLARIEKPGGRHFAFRSALVRAWWMQQ